MFYDTVLVSINMYPDYNRFSTDSDDSIKRALEHIRAPSI